MSINTQIMEEKELFYYQKATQLLGLGMDASTLKKEAIYFRAAKNSAGYKGYLRALSEKAPEVEHTAK